MTTVLFVWGYVAAMSLLRLFGRGIYDLPEITLRRDAVLIVFWPVTVCLFLFGEVYDQYWRSKRDDHIPRAYARERKST